MFDKFSGQQTIARPAVRTLLQNDDPDYQPRSLSFAHGRIRPAPNSPAQAMQVRFTSHLPSMWLEVLSYHVTARRSSDLAKQQPLMQSLEMPEQCTSLICKNMQEYSMHWIMNVYLPSPHQWGETAREEWQESLDPESPLISASKRLRTSEQSQMSHVLFTSIFKCSFQHCWKFQWPFIHSICSTVHKACIKAPFYWSPSEVHPADWFGQAAMCELLLSTRKRDCNGTLESTSKNENVWKIRLQTVRVLPNCLKSLEVQDFS